MVYLGGSDQGGLVGRVCGLKVGARLQQLLNILQAATGRQAHVQRRFMLRIQRVGVGAGGEQRARHGRVAVNAGSMQRRGQRVWRAGVD